jgi:hypothetical protein
MRFAQQHFELRFALLERLSAEILAVELKEIESAKGNKVVFASIADQIEH